MGFPIAPIRDPARHREALAEIELLWGAEPGTPDSDRLDVLMALVDTYERRTWPDEDLDPIDVVLDHDQGRLHHTASASTVGSSGRASEILNHAQAKALVGRLMRSGDPTDRARMAAQARLVEAYERARWPRRAPRLPELLAYLMDQHGLTRADLVPLLGTPSRVSEVLSGKRALSMTMVQRLRARFHVSADLLIPLQPTARRRWSLAA